MTELEKKFTQKLLDKCEFAKSEYGYNPTRFVQMIAQYGGVKTANELIHKKESRMA